MSISAGTQLSEAAAQDSDRGISTLANLPMGRSLSPSCIDGGSRMILLLEASRGRHARVAIERPTHPRQGVAFGLAFGMRFSLILGARQALHPPIETERLTVSNRRLRLSGRRVSAFARNEVRISIAANCSPTVAATSSTSGDFVRKIARASAA